MPEYHEGITMAITTDGYLLHRIQLKFKHPMFFVGLKVRILTKYSELLR